jgi:ribonuclease BN (tRNA processing enzyme)
MILTVVGSGTLVPSPHRSTPALLLQEADFQLSVDGGSGTLRRQAELGIDFRRTHTLVFTHIHPDHCLDVLHFLFASRYTPGYRRLDPVRLIGPPGFARFLDRLREGVRSWTRGGEGGIEVHEAGDGEVLDCGPLRITAVHLDHAVTDLGYRFRDSHGRTAAFTGDTGWCENLFRLAAGVDVLVAECSGDEAHPLTGHLTAPEVGRLANRAGVGQVVLTHLYPLPDDRRRLQEVARHYAGPVLLASDGDRFVV